MKRLRLIFMMALFFSAHFSFSQAQYELKNLGNKYSSEEIHAAFSSADFCGSFYETKRNVLTFDDGAVIELKSRQELPADAISLISDDCFIDDNVHYFESVWTIDPTGHLLKGFDTNTYPSEKEYFHYKN